MQSNKRYSYYSAPLKLLWIRNPKNTRTGITNSNDGAQYHSFNEVRVYPKGRGINPFAIAETNAWLSNPTYK